jgi:hypothetical protein
VDPFTTKDWSVMRMIDFLSNVGAQLSNYTLSHPNVQEILKKQNFFNAVIVEIFWVEALYGIYFFFINLKHTVQSNK